MSDQGNKHALKRSFAKIAFGIWLLTALFLTITVLVYFIVKNEGSPGLIAIVFFIASFLCSIPAFILLLIMALVINKAAIDYSSKIFRFFLLQFFISIVYGLFTGPLLSFLEPVYTRTVFWIIMYMLIAAVVIFFCALAASLVNLTSIAVYFSSAEKMFSFNFILTDILKLNNKKTTVMEPSANEMVQETTSSSNRILIKGVITGALILLLLIPAYFITNLVTERQQRQAKVIKEVSSKWATEQTLSGPYLVLPYLDTYTNDTGKVITSKTNLIVLADDLRINGELIPEKRQRSIYKVLLYKSALTVNGSFKPQWPSDINTSNIDFAGAKLCFGLSDFKGLENEIKINFNNQLYVLTPGLPITDLSEKGLSVPVALSAEGMNTAISFNLFLKLSGSEQLHFLPLASNSRFEIKSSWTNPSFDGNVLPNDRVVNDNGFNAAWSFNRANLPFNMVLRQGKLNAENLSFGVSMVQPADQYEKTMRSVKYAILFIGLTFAFFFVIELLQKKPFHPVQYILVGLALLIFYTLLLSVSEFILFDYAYLLAAAATVSLISLYAKGHFTKWGIAAIFAGALSCLYGFIFVLIRLEDTALLLGSIGLFIILAAVMYLSRKIKWYGTTYQTA